MVNPSTDREFLNLFGIDGAVTHIETTTKNATEKNQRLAELVEIVLDQGAPNLDGSISATLLRSVATNFSKQPSDETSRSLRAKVILNIFERALLENDRETQFELLHTEDSAPVMLKLMKAKKDNLAIYKLLTPHGVEFCTLDELFEKDLNIKTLIEAGYNSSATTPRAKNLHLQDVIDRIIEDNNIGELSSDDFKSLCEGVGVFGDAMIQNSKLLELSTGEFDSLCQTINQLVSWDAAIGMKLVSSFEAKFLSEYSSLSEEQQKTAQQIFSTRSLKYHFFIGVLDRLFKNNPDLFNEKSFLRLFTTNSKKDYFMLKLAKERKDLKTLNTLLRKGVEQDLHTFLLYSVLDIAYEFLQNPSSVTEELKLEFTPRISLSKYQGMVEKRLRAIGNEIEKAGIDARDVSNQFHDRVLGDLASYFAEQLNFKAANALMDLFHNPFATEEIKTKIQDQEVISKLSGKLAELTYSQVVDLSLFLETEKLINKIQSPELRDAWGNKLYPIGDRFLVQIASEFDPVVTSEIQSKKDSSVDAVKVAETTLKKVEKQLRKDGFPDEFISEYRNAALVNFVAMHEKGDSLITKDQLIQLCDYITDDESKEVMLRIIMPENNAILDQDLEL